MIGGSHIYLPKLESSSSNYLIMYLSFIVASPEVNILRKMISLIFIMTFKTADPKSDYTQSWYIPLNAFSVLRMVTRKMSG